MKDIDALLTVYRMAYHTNDLRGRAWTDEEKEALDTVKVFIETNFPLSVRTMLWDIDKSDTRTPEQRKPGPNYVPIGGAGNGA